uniref:C2 domain-containing protein n=1 Tax=Trichobilharzia regenti TaxID=157069 RepID=A0AA85J6E7_TRIRE|nr:unnamed protein product [Trichobilharzia regenti]
MQKDRALKKSDYERIVELVKVFPNKLHPELLHDTMCQISSRLPAVPGSGLVSTCRPILPSRNKIPDEVIPENPRRRGVCASLFPQCAVQTKFSRLCPKCWQKYNPLLENYRCIICGAYVCQQCAFKVPKKILAVMCKECWEIAKCYCKTGDWFNQYVESKLPTPLKFDFQFIQPQSGNNKASGELVAHFAGKWGEKIKEKSKSSMSLPLRQNHENDTRLDKAQNPAEKSKSSMSLPLRQNHENDTRLDKAQNPAVSEQSTRVMKKRGRKRRFLRRKLTRNKFKNKSLESLKSNPKSVNEMKTLSHSALELNFPPSYQPSESLGKQVIPSNSEETGFIKFRKKSFDTMDRFNRLEIDVSMEYDVQDNQLAVTIWAVRNLSQEKQKIGIPYATVQLLPDDTKYNIKLLNPQKWNEVDSDFCKSVCFPIHVYDLNKKIIFIQLWCKKAIISRMTLGQVIIPVGEYNLNSIQRQTFRLLKGENHLSYLSMSPHYNGQIIIALRFSISESQKCMVLVTDGAIDLCGTLEVWIKKGINLSSKSSKEITSYVTVALTDENNVTESHNTDYIQRTNKPLWNSLLKFPDKYLSDLSKFTMKLTIWNRFNRTGPPELLGFVQLCTKGAEYKFENPTDEDTDCYQQCIRRPNTTLWDSIQSKPGTWVQETLNIHPPNLW